jgi:hypothetical protein
MESASYRKKIYKFPAKSHSLLIERAESRTDEFSQVTDDVSQATDEDSHITDNVSQLMDELSQ